ncbi:MAG: hypothetical protein DSZ09_03660, partial [Sulfurovum sp.]
MTVEVSASCTDPNKYALDCDLDGDGIINNLDIDDDNDGILDADESPNCFYSATEVNELNATGSELVWNTSYDYPKATDG